MAEDQAQKKAQKATMVVPPNQLKEKVGSGGFDEMAVVKAQDQIKNNKVDFRPIAADLLIQMDKAIADAKSGAARDAVAVREIMTPAMELKAQGTLFHYPLVSEISNILVNFLETVTSMDADALEIVAAHKTSINVVLAGRIKEEDKGKVGKELCRALLDSCDRYSKTRKKQ
jgi:hypothetical protein